MSDHSKSILSLSTQLMREIQQRHISLQQWSEPNLGDAILDSTEQVFVHLSRQGIVQQDVGALLVRAKGPHRAGGQHIPAVLLPEEVGHLLAGPVHVDQPLLNVQIQPLPEQPSSVSPIPSALSVPEAMPLLFRMNLQHKMQTGFLIQNKTLDAQHVTCQGVQRF